MDLPLQDLDSVYEPLNYCMYCGSLNNLTDEHIIPYGLHGPGILPKSACKDCAKETGSFEGFVLRGPWWGLSAYLKRNSRRPKEAPTYLPFTILRDGEEEVVELPLEDHPVLLYFPKFSPPSLITGYHVQGISLSGVFIYNLGKPIDLVLAGLGAKSFRLPQTSNPVPFARMIAKIGWAMACAQRHHLRLDLDKSIGPVIVNKPNEIGRWVGTYADSLEKAEGALHEVRIREEQGLILADVKFFSYSNTNTPRYGVILGPLK